MTACVPTTRNRALAADKTDNRSLKSRLIAMFSPDGIDFGRHLPGCGKSALRSDTFPEFQVEGPVVLRGMAEDPDHTDGVTAIRAHTAAILDQNCTVLRWRSIPRRRRTGGERSSARLQAPPGLMPYPTGSGVIC